MVNTVRQQYKQHKIGTSNLRGKLTNGHCHEGGAMGMCSFIQEGQIYTGPGHIHDVYIKMGI